MDFEQILIRLGLDAKALTAGLTRTTSLVKGWATGLASDLKHHFIGAFAGIYIFDRIFEGIKEKALWVNRTVKETGLNSNMVQGIANELGNVGEGFEGVTKPLNKFNALIGQAKEGSKEARTKLMDLGIVTKAEEFQSLNLSKALVALKIQLDKVGDASVRAARLESIGKGMERLIPILELSEKKLANLDKSNFFTKLTPESLEAFGSLTRGGKSLFNAGVATIGNIALGELGIVLNLRKGWQAANSEATKSMGFLEAVKHTSEEIKNGQNEQTNAAKETTEAYLERKKVQEEILKLENQIGDRSKLTVDQLDQRFREITGDKRPRGLERIHAITPQIASGHRIKSLELEAEAASASGQFDRAAQLQSQAAQLRTTNFSLKSTEREPNREVEFKLEQIHEALTRSGIIVDKINDKNR